MSDVRNLDRRLVLEERRRTADGAGGFDESWAALGTLWAVMEPARGREVTGAAGALARVPWRITVRGAPMGSPRRPRAGQRLRDGGRVFAVLAVAEADPGGRYLTCFAEEEAAP